MKSSDEVALNSVRRWFEKAVLGLNLCPFAARPYQQDSILFELSSAINDEQCLSDIYLNCRKLDQNSEIETILLVCPHHLSRFVDYNQFLTLAELLLEQEGWQGVYQIASFHPDYRFADTEHDERSNWTNRTPFPVFHLIREASLGAALENFPKVEQVPERNIQKLHSLSPQQMRAIYGGQFKDKT